MEKKHELLPSDHNLPKHLRIISISEKPLFPGIFTPLILYNKENLAVIEDALEHNGFIGVVLQREEVEAEAEVIVSIDSEDEDNEHIIEHENEVEAEEEKELELSDFYAIGTVAKIVKRIHLPNGGVNIFLSTIKRFRMHRLISPIPLVAEVEYVDDVVEENLEMKAMTSSLITEMRKLTENNSFFSEEIRLNIVNIDNPVKMTDFVTSILNIPRDEQQDMLETLNVRDRIEKVLVFIKKEQELFRIQKKIQKQINQKLEKSQREYFLREQLKIIKKELGIPTDGKTDEYQRFKDAIDNLALTDEVAEQVLRELDKFSMLDSNSGDYNVTRNYLDTIISLPWNDTKKPKKINVKKAQHILDTDHYGLDDVKERITEFIAIRQRKADYNGAIICLVGPPGVGKTSIGKSIAHALGRKFFRFSVGGMRDESEIKGHRRTYIGAMPGKILQGLKIVKENDPVFMIDEVDKMGISYQGDPSSALLEVLDPEQNVQFRDHYLDLPFDISKIIFIVTANTLDSIPRPLLDRMEIIRLSGYISEEKVMIAKKYLVPKLLEKNSLKTSEVSIPNKTLKILTEHYAREAGVRYLEQLIDKMFRKVTKHIVMNGDDILPITIEGNLIEHYLGKPRFSDERNKIIRAGMVTGLAWTSMGGETLVIEAIAIEQDVNGLKLTGQMGDVMQESANIAYTYVKSLDARKHNIEVNFFSRHMVHLHIPAGATPKDGPSAGITMATTLYSLVTQQKVSRSIAMTGELSLSGMVLPIGGLKEKVIAAKRQGIKTIIIPLSNKRDLDEIPENIKRGIEFHTVELMQQVLDITFK